jgi:hypothetical protein
MPRVVMPQVAESRTGGCREIWPRAAHAPTLAGPVAGAVADRVRRRRFLIALRGLNGWRLGLQEAGRLVSPLFGAGLFALAGGGM